MRIRVAKQKKILQYLFVMRNNNENVLWTIKQITVATNNLDFKINKSLENKINWNQTTLKLPTK